MFAATIGTATSAERKETADGRASGRYETEHWQSYKQPL